MRKHISILEDFPREKPQKYRRTSQFFQLKISFMKNDEKFTFNFAGKLITVHLQNLRASLTVQIQPDSCSHWNINIMSILHFLNITVVINALIP